MQTLANQNDIEEKLNQILINQQLIFLYLKQILKDTNKSHFMEDYAANLSAQMTELLLCYPNKK